MASRNSANIICQSGLNVEAGALLTMARVREYQGVKKLRKRYVTGTVVREAHIPDGRRHQRAARCGAGRPHTDGIPVQQS